MARTKKATPAVIPIARPKLDPDAPLVEGFATRTAMATGYPIRDADHFARLVVQMETHGTRNQAGQLIVRVTVEQSEGPQRDGVIELPVTDLSLFLAVFRKCIEIGDEGGVFDVPLTTAAD